MRPLLIIVSLSAFVEATASNISSNIGGLPRPMGGRNAGLETATFSSGNGATESPPELRQRETSPAFHWSYLGTNDTTELAARSPLGPRTTFSERTRLAGRLLLGGAAVTYAVQNFYGLVKDCKEMHEDKDQENGFMCVVGAMVTTTLVIGHAEQAKDWAVWYAGEWARGFSANLAFDFTRFIAQYGLGPFIRQPAQGQIGKRGELMKRHVLVQAEDTLSSAMRAEVRYIGDWDEQGANTGQVGKRDGDAKSHPVFGVNLDGRDYHFALMGTDTKTDSIRVRVGFGPGAETEHNVQRLKARDKPGFNTQHFDRGGLDALGRSDIAGSLNEPDIMPDEKSQEDFDWLLKQMACYMGAEESDHPSQADAQGLWYQVYDDKYHNTLTAGAIAPFGPDSPSAISWMSIQDGIPTIDKCIIHDEL